MYFWKIEKLKDELKSSEVSERDLFLYLLIPTVLFYLAFEWSYWENLEGLNSWDLISSVGTITIVIAGSILCFLGNGGDRGTDFLKRYISISFVMSIRVLSLMLLLFIPLFFYYTYSHSDNPELASSAVDTIPFLLLEVWFFWRIYFHILDVKNT